MKRTPLQRRTPLKARTELRRTGPPPRRTPLKNRSAKTTKLHAKRSRVKKRVMEDAHGMCGIPLRVANELTTSAMEVGDRAHEVVWHGYRQMQSKCLGVATDIHEPLTRARGGSIIDRGNMIPVCRMCHDWIHENPEIATMAGLLIPSWTKKGDG